MPVAPKRRIFTAWPRSRRRPRRRRCEAERHARELLALVPEPPGERRVLRAGGDARRGGRPAQLEEAAWTPVAAARCRGIGRGPERRERAVRRFHPEDRVEQARGGRRAL